jgi:hypothetical protein
MNEARDASDAAVLDAGRNAPALVTPELIKGRIYSADAMHTRDVVVQASDPR